VSELTCPQCGLDLSAMSQQDAEVTIESAWSGQLDLVDVASGSRHTLRLSGALDMASSTGLNEALVRLCADGAQAITLDLTNLEFMDSTGLYAILSAKELCQRNEYEFSLIQGPASIRRLFEVTGLLDSLPFQPIGVDGSDRDDR
jgi:anti-sigma B factor antagonist